MQRTLLLMVALLGVIGCAKEPAAPPPQSEVQEPVLPEVASNNPPPVEPAVQPPAVNPPAEPPAAAAPVQEPLALQPQAFSFDLDGAKYTLPAPAGAKIKRDQDSVELHAGKRYNVRIEFGKRNLADPQSLPIARGASAQAVTETAETLLLKDVEVDLGTLEKTQYFQFATNVTLGHRDFVVVSLSRDADFGSTKHSEADCRAMLAAAQQLALAEPVPEDPAAILETFRATVGKDDAGQIVSLSLPSFGITDATMPLVAKLPDLKTLFASNVDAGKEALAVIGQLGKLETLDLAGTAVDDSAVDWIRKLTALRKLTIANTKITDAGRQQLKEALPECEIE
jgi:hypothetical protein